MVQDCDQHGRDTAEHGAVFTADNLQYLQGIKGDQRMQGRANAKGSKNTQDTPPCMEERHGSTKMVVLAYPPATRKDCSVVENGALGLDGSLREAGGARSVEDLSGICWFYRCLPFAQRIWAHLRAICDHLAEERWSPTFLLQ